MSTLGNQTLSEAFEVIYLRPPYSYKVLISMVIRESEQIMLSANDIVQKIIEKFPYYQTYDRSLLKRSIRSTLYQNDCFTRIYSSQPGTLNKWMLAENSPEKSTKSTTLQSNTHDMDMPTFSLNNLNQQELYQPRRDIFHPMHVPTFGNTQPGHGVFFLNQVMVFTQHPTFSSGNRS
jgi:hypothetical protein